MTSYLTYDLRTGIVSGVVAGRQFHTPTHFDLSKIDAWRCKPIADSVSAGAVGHRLPVVENGDLEIYDYPEGRAFPRPAPAPPGPIPIPYPNHSAVGPIVQVKDSHDRFFIHGPPPCNHDRCIVITHGWEVLVKALAEERRLTFFVQY